MVDGIKVDAHFWVERDGKIYDSNSIWAMDMMILFNVEKVCYIPLKDSDAIVEEYTRQRREQLSREGYDWDTAMERIECNGDSSVRGRCWQAAMLEQYKNGGRVVIGYFGFIKDGVCEWLYGHPLNRDEEIWRSGDDPTGVNNLGVSTPITKDVILVDYRNLIGQSYPDLIPELRPASRIKLGRNDKCHCGSNKKYKKCCGKFA